MPDLYGDFVAHKFVAQNVVEEDAFSISERNGPVVGCPEFFLKKRKRGVGGAGFRQDQGVRLGTKQTDCEALNFQNHVTNAQNTP